MSDTTSSERLHKYLARCGIASRRKCEELIAAGRVTVNDMIVVELGTKVGPEDKVALDTIVVVPQRLMYLLMNKPKGYATTMSDPNIKRKVTDILPALDEVVKPVGRLDMDTAGALMFTNDGELAMRLTHPRYGVEKEYVAKIEGQISQKAVDKLRKGVWIEGGKTKPAGVTVLATQPNQSTVKIVIHEGRNKQVKLMCLAVGHRVKELERTKFGPLTLFKLPSGACRMLGKQEVDELKKLVGMTQPLL